MAVLGRNQVLDKCMFCGQEPETIGHIFGNCSFLKPLWQRILHSCGIHRNFASWPDEII